MSRIDPNRNGIPDFAEGMVHSMNQSDMSVDSTVTESPRHSAPIYTSPTITPDTSNGWMLVLSGLIIFFLCVAGAGAVWYFFLR